MSTAYRVTGMTCGGCARAVTRAIEDAAPGAVVEVALDDQTIRVDGADAAQVKTAVEAAGFDFEGRI